MGLIKRAWRGGILRTLCRLWAFPNTLLGLLLALPVWLFWGRMHRVQGVIEVHGPVAAWLLGGWLPPRRRIEALTLGHVMIGRSARGLDDCRAHEHVHVGQYERWGPFFLPAYLLASVVAALLGKRAYRDNPFERAAYDTARRHAAPTNGRDGD